MSSLIRSKALCEANATILIVAILRHKIYMGGSAGVLADDGADGLVMIISNIVGIMLLSYKPQGL
eukprot:scaffold561421_cov39-Prasinocladus_malaysianus.AAC.1